METKKEPKSTAPKSDAAELTDQLKGIKEVTTPPGICVMDAFRQLTDPTQRPIWELDEDFINPYKELPPVQCWCEMGGRKALPKEGIITFSAKQKKGKSLSTYALALPLLSGKDFGTIHPTGERPNLVMVFDMEMAESTLIKRVRGQIESIGEYGRRFAVCNLKPKSIEERLAIIQAKIERYNPDIVIIDQAGKLVHDINNVSETNQVTDILDKLSIGRSVICVMHENKSKEDSNMRGHMGSSLSFANVEAYTVDRKNGIFEITYKEGRDTDADGAATLQFTLDEDGRIIDGAERLKKATEEERGRWLNNFIQLFGTDEVLRAKEIVARIMQTEGLEERAAKNKMAKAIDKNVIRKTGPLRTDPYELCRPEV